MLGMIGGGIKMKTKDVRCPRCKLVYYNKGSGLTHPALSRRDNKTWICSGCGTEEAMFDFRTYTEAEDERAWLKEVKK